MILYAVRTMDKYGCEAPRSEDEDDRRLVDFARAGRSPG